MDVPKKGIGGAVSAAAAILALLLLAGCGSFGNANISDTAGNLLAFNSPSAPPAPTVVAAQEAKIDCPQIEVQDGTAALRAYAGGQTNADVRYQYSLGDTARECQVNGKQISIKVGVEGRVLIGPKGSPGSFTAPIRVAIRGDADHKVLVSKLYRVPVTVPAGSAEAPFSLVTDPLVIPLLHVRADDDYTILVGFDSGAPTDEAAPHRRHKRS